MFLEIKMRLVSSDHFSSAHDTGNVCLPDNRLKYELTLVLVQNTLGKPFLNIFPFINSMYVKDVSEYGRVGGGESLLLSCN